MDIGDFQDAVFLTPIAGSSNPIKLLDKTIDLYNTDGINSEVIGKFMYCLALICNTYTFDLNDESYKFLRGAAKSLNIGENDEY
jgi:hypothetical protein